MPEESAWRRARVREIARIYGGGTPSREDPSLWNGDIPWLTPGELTSGDARFTCCTQERITPAGVRSSGAVVMPPGSLLVTTRATLGACTVAAAPIATNQGFKNLRFDSKVADAGFYYYLFRGLKRELERRASGTTFLEISTKELGNIEVPVPPLVEQRRIVEVLDAIAEAKQSVGLGIAKLVRMREGELSAALDGLDVVPMCRVADLFEVKSGITLGPDRRPRTSARPYLRVANVQRGRIELSDLATLEAFTGDSTKYSLAAGDLLVVEGHANPQEIGRCALVGPEAAGLLYQNHLFKLRSSRVDPRFSEMWLNSKAVRSYWLATATTSSGLHTINRAMVEEIPFPGISRSGQLGIVDRISAFDDRINLETAALGKLRTLEKGLAGDLLIGRFRIGELC